MSDLILPPGVEYGARPEPFPPAPPGVGMIVNESDLPDEVVMDYFVENASLVGLSPTNGLQMYGGQGAGSMMTRPKWRPPGTIIEEIIVCRELADRDDDVGATIGMMTALAFGEGMQHANRDEVSVAMFDEIAKKGRILQRFKEMYREWLISYQVTTAVVWEQKPISFVPMGADRQRSRTVAVPRVAILPSEQIRVLGNDIFGGAALAYRPFSGRQEVWLQEYFSVDTSPARKAEMGRQDPVLTTLLTEQIPYEDPSDPVWVYSDLYDPVIGQYVYKLNPNLVHRTTGPKGQWQHPRPMMSRNLPLLEAKRLLTVMDYCVPIGTQILTERGWLEHDEVRVGDRTLGYNPETAKNEWTSVTGIHHTQAEVIEMKNAYWSAKSTPNHRWYATWDSWNHDGREYEGFIATKDLKGKKHLKLTAPAEGGESDLTPDEAALIAWIACDGNIFQHPKGSWTVHVYQSKLDGLEALRKVLTAFPHRSFVKKSKQLATMYTFTVLGSYVQNLFERAGLDREMTALSDVVLALSPEARAAFLRACQDAEGWLNKKTPCLAQNEGPVLDAMVLCAYLCGERPTVRSVGGSETCKVVSLNLRKTVKVDKLKKRSLGLQETWCVQTDLGSWTMRQDDAISLTGNCLLEAGANFLLVVKKGTDQRPALPAEMAALKETIVRASRSGVLVGDHRLTVDIITPKLDELLNADKRKLLGRKLAAALLRTPDIGSADTAGAMEVQTTTEILSRVIHSDRDDLNSHMEDAVYQPTADRNKIESCGIWFPKIVLQGLQFFQDMILGLRDRGDIPRKYAVEAAGFSWTAAVEQRKLEKSSGDDKVMTPAAVPFSSPNAGPQDRGGGRPAGAATGKNTPTAAGTGKTTVQKNAGETIKAMWDGEDGPIWRTGELTFAVLEEYAEVRKVGRISKFERTALGQIEANPSEVGILTEGPVTVIPVNREYAIEDVTALRLTDGVSMLVGRRLEDNAIVARALAFRAPLTQIDAEEWALRFGFDV